MVKNEKPTPELRGRRRSMVTPEGVDLGVQLASRGARWGAFLVDLTVLGVVMILLGWRRVLRDGFRRYRVCLMERRHDAR